MPCWLHPHARRHAREDYHVPTLTRHLSILFRQLASPAKGTSSESRVKHGNRSVGTDNEFAENSAETTCVRAARVVAFRYRFGSVGRFDGAGKLLRPGLVKVHCAVKLAQCGSGAVPAEHIVVTLTRGTVMPLTDRGQLR